MSYISQSPASIPTYPTLTAYVSSDFWLGSSADVCGHAAAALTSPSTYLHATGGSLPGSEYVHTVSAWVPQPVFSYRAPSLEVAHESCTDKDPIHRVLPNSNSSSLDCTLSSICSPTTSLPIPMTVTLQELTECGSTETRNDQYKEGEHVAISQTHPPSMRTHLVPKSKDTSNKDKRHPCWMCHKSFDRPSTLSKHMLVHTGEKAFQCEMCGKRFGVASNLNRHTKRCAQRSINAGAVGASSPGSEIAGFSQASASVCEDGSAATASHVGVQTIIVAPTIENRKRNSSSPDSVGGSSDAQPRRKRRRRAPSPSRWIPESLRCFDLTPIVKSTPVPLPPVQPYRNLYTDMIEERDSYATGFSSTPYHPSSWRNVLPGPAATNEELGAMGGRLVVF